MKTGMGLVLIGIGAILAFAVTTNTSVFNLHTAGYVVMIIGILGLAVPRRGYGWVGRRLFVRQAPWGPGRPGEGGGSPPHANPHPATTRNPANPGARPGRPAPGAFGSPEAGTHLDATRNLSTEPLGPRPGETE